MSDATRRASREYKKRNLEKLKIAHKHYAQTHKDIMHRIRTDYISNHPEWKLFQIAKSRAKRLGLEFSITIDDIFIPKYCPYLGVELTNIIGNGRQKFNISLDRIDSSLGYIPGNVQVISELANRMKNNATEEQLITFSEHVLFMKKWKHIDRYLTELSGDIYEQPDSEGHTNDAEAVINAWIGRLGCKTVLDLGCGTGFCQPMFEKFEINYTGICLGKDYSVANELKRNVKKMDFNFLDYDDNSFDLLFARHSLEHSPMPLLTLMEWHRVSNKWLCLIMPNPRHFTYSGRNHYSVFDVHHIIWLLRRAGWKIVSHELTGQEFRFLCSKEPRVSYEGYANAPLSGAIHEFERDNFEIER